MSDSFVYFLLALPNSGNAEKSIGNLHNILKSNGAECEHLSKIPIERLRVGTLDKLISLSDDFSRIDAFGKTVVQKLHRTHSEFEESEQLLSVQNQSIHNYMFNFNWDDGHFNPHAQLRDLVQSIHSNMTKTAEHLRKKTSALSELHASLQNISRKKSGSLMNKSLVEYVNRQSWYDGEYLRSALIVIPTTKTADFLKQYEFMEDSDANNKYEAMLQKQIEQQQELEQAREEHEQQQEQEQEQEEEEEEFKSNSNSNSNSNQAKPMANPKDSANKSTFSKYNVSQIRNHCRIVVPESAKLLGTDQEYSLYSIMLLKRGYEWYKYVCLQFGYNVRDFSIADLDVADDEKETLQLQKTQASQQKKLRMFCLSNFSQIFTNWIHLKIIRLFVESVLRYGLPVDFSITIVKPGKNKEKRLLKILEKNYQHLLDKVLQGNQENEIDYSGLSSDFYPFVYVPLSFTCSN